MGQARLAEARSRHPAGWREEPPASSGALRSRDRCLSKDAVRWSLEMLVVDRLSVSRIADALKLAWNTAEAQPSTSAVVSATPPDHCWKLAESDPVYPLSCEEMLSVL